jgi:four helix bundle protein
VAQVLRQPAFMTPQELRDRTWQFSRRTHRFCVPLLRHADHGYPAGQLRRAAASAAANYRAACISRTTPGFIAKLDIALEEADEAEFWARDLADAGLASEELAWILDEARQLTRILGASRRTARGR